MSAQKLTLTPATNRIIVDPDTDAFEVPVSRVILVDQIVTGPPGPQGPTGAAGAGFQYTHTQGVPDTTWTIVHNLNGYPNVSLVDSTGDEFSADVTYDSPNQITVTLAYAISGYAYLS